MTIPARIADKLFSDVYLPEETLTVRTALRANDPSDRTSIEHTPESKDIFPRAMVKAMADAGIYAIPYGKNVGGRGLEYPMLATVVVGRTGRGPAHAQWPAGQSHLCLADLAPSGLASKKDVHASERDSPQVLLERP